MEDHYDKDFVFLLTLILNAQTELVIADESQTYDRLENTTVKMYGTSELHVNHPSDPLPGSIVNLYSKDAWVFFDHIRPFVDDATFL